MAGKVLSIEVGYSITRVVEMDLGVKSPKVYTAFSFETPPNVLSDEGVMLDESMVELMKQNLKKHGVKTNKAIFAISSTRIANREVVIPLVKDNKIKSLLIANSRDYFPVDLAQYELVYRVLERMKEEKQMKLVVFAVPRPLVESYQNIARSWGLTIVGMDYSGNSISQSINRFMDKKFSMVLRVDDRISTLTIMKEGYVELHRTIGYGIDEAVELVRACEALRPDATYTDALDLMRRKTCLNRQLRPESEDMEFEDIVDPDIMDIRNNVTGALSMLIGNISRVLDYYISRNQDLSIEQIHLIGLGADCSGLSKLLTNELGIKVVAVQELTDANLNRSIKKARFKVAEYLVCIGATFEPLNFMFESAESKKGKSSNESLLGSVLIAALISMVGLGLIAFAAIRNMDLKAEQIALNVQISNLSYIEEIVAAYNQAEADYDWTKKVRELSENENENLVAFIEEMERKMPSEIRVISISVTEENVTMNIEVTTKTEAASVIAKLRNFESIRVTPSGISAITETRDEFDHSTVSFTIECTYMTPSEPEEDTQEDGTEAQEG